MDDLPLLVELVIQPPCTGGRVEHASLSGVAWAGSRYTGQNREEQKGRMEGAEQQDTAEQIRAE